MQLDAQTFLRIVEKSGELCSFDIEATNLKGTYGSVLVVAIKPYHRPPKIFTVEYPGLDRKVVKEAAQELAKYACWISYYGRGFDIPMLRTRGLIGGCKALPVRHHLDLYFSVVASKLNTARRSQAHLLEALYPKGNAKTRKMTLSPEEWNLALNEKTRARAMRVMVRRCASDVEGLEKLYDRTKHLIMEVTR